MCLECRCCTAAGGPKDLTGFGISLQTTGNAKNSLTIMTADIVKVLSLLVLYSFVMMILCEPAWVPSRHLS